MILDLSRFVRFMAKHGITAHQFMLPYMLYMDEKVKQGSVFRYNNLPGTDMPIANLYRYSKAARGWTDNEVADLANKNLIINRNTKEPSLATGKIITSPDLMQCTEYFKETIFAPENRFEEFLATYPVAVPNFRDASAPSIPLQLVKGPGELEELEKFYNRVVRSQEMHERVIRVTRWAKEHGYISMNISKYIASKHWDALLNIWQESQSNVGTNKVNHLS